MGHCSSDDLLDHINIFLKDLDIDHNYLIQVGMDGPNVNLSFEKKLRRSMESDFNTSFLDMETCSLHPVHTTFRKGVLKLEMNVDEFFHDIFFFFKHSSACREDYASVEEVTEVVARYAMQHTETR